MSEQAVQKWEYRSVNLVNFSESDRRSFLNDLGNLGWEMCGFSGFEHDVVFKRQLTGEE